MDANAECASSTSKPGSATEATGPWPTLADILKGNEEIRKDKAHKKMAFKVEMPESLAADLHAIEKLFEDDRPSWGVPSAHLEAAKPFEIPIATFPLVLETGQALVRTPPVQILHSFARDHGNEILWALFKKKGWPTSKGTRE
uniref:AlNc14C354G10937 protein n=1 Tax=Albugo laibachii Nc14 TaxID=890382 RepID=F0WXI6_9STRA|nr:AlNc14C354G10937 [Albugo laibachii Nc14]|eukprot:CCA26180.1 AlNc14C354G10937 [Albugo laibachii Nc14]